VYEIDRKDNEQRSATEADRKLNKLGVPPEKIERVHQEILATQHHQSDGDSDTRYLVDFDLAILGESPEKYENYSQQILKEYAQYPRHIYKRGRKKVLQHFLNLERIYQTEDFHSGFEQQARKNLEEEIESL
jgi:predicted metal-dependent HD superfamily phosphohydrolase